MNFSTEQLTAIRDYYRRLWPSDSEIDPANPHSLENTRNFLFAIDAESCENLARVFGPGGPLHDPELVSTFQEMAFERRGQHNN